IPPGAGREHACRPSDAVGLARAGPEMAAYRTRDVRAARPGPSRAEGAAALGRPRPGHGGKLAAASAEAPLQFAPGRSGGASARRGDPDPAPASQELVDASPGCRLSHLTGQRNGPAGRTGGAADRATCAGSEVLVGPGVRRLALRPRRADDVVLRSECGRASVNALRPGPKVEILLTQSGEFRRGTGDDHVVGRDDAF